mmetsp:Transcript_114561/g.286312  ORF Transcript_114561/g.286312 Transcript_114561/m.286312 type:complete len:261 (+) Transcript_114561:2521-3303(+)
MVAADPLVPMYPTMLEGQMVSCKITPSDKHPSSRRPSSLMLSASASPNGGMTKLPTKTPFPPTMSGSALWRASLGPTSEPILTDSPTFAAFITAVPISDEALCIWSESHRSSFVSSSASKGGPRMPIAPEVTSGFTARVRIMVPMEPNKVPAVFCSNPSSNPLPAEAILLMSSVDLAATSKSTAGRPVMFKCFALAVLIAFSESSTLIITAVEALTASFEGSSRAPLFSTLPRRLMQSCGEPPPASAMVAATEVAEFSMT